MALTVGLALTVKALAREPTPASVLVTVTVRAPVAAPDSTVIVAFSSVELTKLVDSTVTPAPKLELAPLTRLEEWRVGDWLLAPWPREEGLVDSTLGPALTVKALAEPAPASVLLVTVAVRRAVAAPDST